MVDLSVKIGALTLKNPVLTASGTFGYASEFQDFFDLSELGGIVTKTITLEARPGNKPPRIWETAGGMLNSIGLPNAGVEVFLAERMEYLRTLGTAVIINVAGRTGKEYAEIVARLDEVQGIDAIELNYSCPNVKEGGLAFSSDPDVAERVTRAVRKRTRRPLIAKLTPNVTAIGEIGLACENGGADAVSAINTLVGMAVDIRSRRPRLSTVTGGLSGPAIRPVALAKVYELVKKIHIPVIGIGGISSAADALEFLIAGATAVEVGTASFMNPRAALEVVAGLRQYCQEQGIAVMSQLIGTLQTHAPAG